jgi:hypothetical protein
MHPFTEALRASQMKHRRSLLIALGVVFLASASAWAGIADSPLPELAAGQRTYHLYSVPGIVQQGSYGAFFACTSTDSVSIRVSAEVFGNLGGSPVNDAVVNALTVAPGATVVFGVADADWFLVDSLLGGAPGPKISARILATSKKVACTAFIATRLNGGVDGEPTFPLTIIAKTKQKAAN